MSSELGRKPVGDRMPIPNWIVADLAARNAITEARPTVAISALDIGRVCRVGTVAPFAYYVLEGVSPLSWSNDLASAGTGVSDHGGLTGLGDNDHPQYALASDVTTALAAKADAAATTSALAAKADAAATTTALAGKAAVATQYGFTGSRGVSGNGTAQKSDAGAAIDLASSGTQTIPKQTGNPATDLPVNCLLTYFNTGNGVHSFAPVDGSVTLVPQPGKTLQMKAGEGAVVQGRQQSADRWYFFGDLEESA